MGCAQGQELDSCGLRVRGGHRGGSPPYHERGEARRAPDQNPNPAWEAPPGALAGDAPQATTAAPTASGRFLHKRIMRRGWSTAGEAGALLSSSRPGQDVYNVQDLGFPSGHEWEDAGWLRAAQLDDLHVRQRVAPALPAPCIRAAWV